MAFGERLQELCRARGMTQEDFAAQLKVSRQAVSKWESCRGYPELEKIIYICNRYGVTMNDLFCEEVPLGGQETPAAPERMESRTLKTALGDFVSNLSPANKWAGVGGLAAVTALVALCMLYLKGGGDSEMTALWIAAIVVFGVVEARCMRRPLSMGRQFQKFGNSSSEITFTSSRSSTTTTAGRTILLPFLMARPAPR